LLESLFQLHSLAWLVQLELACLEEICFKERIYELGDHDIQAVKVQSHGDLPPFQQQCTGWL